MKICSVSLTSLLEVIMSGTRTIFTKFTILFTYITILYQYNFSIDVIIGESDGSLEQ